jgi:hypothetical protein
VITNLFERQPKRTTAMLTFSRCTFRCSMASKPLVFCRLQLVELETDCKNEFYAKQTDRKSGGSPRSLMFRQIARFQQNRAWSVLPPTHCLTWADGNNPHVWECSRARRHKRTGKTCFSRKTGLSHALWDVLQWSWARYCVYHGLTLLGGWTADIGRCNYVLRWTDS